MSFRMVHGIWRDTDAEERAYRASCDNLARILDRASEHALTVVCARYEIEPDEFRPKADIAVPLLPR